EAALGVSPDEGAALASGHPLFLEEIARHPSDAARLEDALTTRIAALPPDARLVLEQLAVAGAPIPQSTLARAADLDRAAAAQGIAALRDAHLVRASSGQARDCVEAYHATTEAVVLAEMKGDAKRAHHARLARALEEAGTTHERERLALVRHLEGAGEAE